MDEANRDPTRNFWLEVLQDMPASVYHQQERANPFPAPYDDPQETVVYCTEQYARHESGQNNHCEFATGWYKGYVAFLVVESVIGEKGISKSLSSANKFRSQLKTAAKKLDDVPALNHVHKPHAKTTKLAHRLAADGGHEYIDYHGIAADLNRRGYTSGKIVTATDRLNDIDGAILRELSSSDQTALATRLATSPDGDSTIRT